MMRRALVLLALAACGGTRAPDGGGARAAEPRPGRRVAIYSEGGAIVVDRRWLELPAGDSRIELGDLAATVEPGSLTMRAVAGPGPLALGERTFDPGLARAPAAAEAILAEALGREVAVDRGGAVLRGRLVAVRGGEIVIAQGGSLRTVPWRDADGLALAGRRRVGRPALIARVTAPRAGRYLVELVYAADGLSFAASYAVRLRGGGAEIRPTAAVDNASGLDLGGARLALYSGRLGASAEAERPVAFWAGAALLPAEPARVETRQLSFPLARVPARIEAVYQGALPDTTNPVSEPVHGTAMQQTVVRHLLVASGGALPAVLPPGDALVEVDGAGGGSERLPTRLAERVLAGGEARFELDPERLLFGDRRQVRVEKSPDGRQLTEAYELTVRNAGREPARVRVIEPLTRSRRVTIVRADPPPDRRKGRKLEWLVTVPPRGESKVSFEATYRF
ncbi:MAG TPA: hypothetical protein VFU21_29650 [Kofleriaceae bacterium]|nr:hypothetical protein [Kofleriaceae bacterium]